MSSIIYRPVATAFLRTTRLIIELRYRTFLPGRISFYRLDYTPYSFCEALQCQPGDILSWEPDSPE
ncbi:helix-turn-helix domain-containing protein [Enterobacter asburiae]|uniref:helix-turn-helix domain-containing protein n=1 Tax=Enterobacter asburiae TaxID=61645 RepID=UPI000F8843A8|nr:helix-turn-helix transcriptional regulator [Enterobacter asburiae]RTP89486.1 XRE family transcriptional regulator [Enterobacter asburiae]